MKNTMKITASLLAAAMSLSILGTASAGAVEFSVDDGKPATTDPVQKKPDTFISSTVQNAVPDFFDGCIKFSWSPVKGAANYALKICSTDNKILKTYIVSSKQTAVVVPETVFAVDYNSSKDFYACVIALKPNQADASTDVYYAPASSKFTVKYDMSEYPDYGTAQNVAFMVNDGKLLIGWKNPNDFAGTKDVFSVTVSDRSGKTIFTKDVAACNVEATGLKDGETYTVRINNRTFAAVMSTEYKFVSDLVAKTPGQGSSEKSPKKGTEYTLPAPISISVKPGDGKLTLSWSKVDEAYAYRIYMYDAKAKKYKAYKTVKGTKRTIKELTNGKTYKFKVTPLRYDSKTKKYTPGKSSRAVSGTPTKPKSNKQ